MAANTQSQIRDKNREACKLDATILRQARIIAAHEGKSISEVLERHLRGPIQRQYEKTAAEIGGEGGA